MTVSRGFDGADPILPGTGGDPGEERVDHRRAHAGHVAVGTFACPECDAPVAPGGPLRPAELVACPYCGHGGRVRDFLTLGSPTRAAHVVVRVGPVGVSR